MAYAESLKNAILTIFHSSCPHPVHYREDGVINAERFNEDLQTWLTTVTATWLTMTPTGHQANCRCCINFRHLCINYETEFSDMLQEQYEMRRITKSTIDRWGQMPESNSYRQTFQSLREVAKAWITNANHVAILDISSESEQLSSNVDDIAIADQTFESDESEEVSSRKFKKPRIDTQIGTGIRMAPLTMTTDTGVLAQNGRVKRTTIPYACGEPSTSFKRTRSSDCTSETQAEDQEKKTLTRRFVADISTIHGEVIVSDLTTGKGIKVLIENRDPIWEMFLSLFIQNLIICANKSSKRLHTFLCLSKSRQRKEILKSHKCDKCG